MFEGTLTIVAILVFFFLVATVHEFVMTRWGHRWAFFAVIFMFLSVAFAADISKHLHEQKVVCEVRNDEN